MSGQGTLALDEALCGRIDIALHALHLPGALARYRDLVQELGLDDRALHLLEGALTAERESRELHRYERNLRAARFPVVKELAGFDFTALPSLSKERVDELATGRAPVCRLRPGAGGRTGLRPLQPGSGPAALHLLRGPL